MFKKQFIITSLHLRETSGDRVSENNVKDSLPLFHLIPAAQGFVHSLNTFEESPAWRVAKTSLRPPQDLPLAPKGLQAIVKKDVSQAQVRVEMGLPGATGESMPKPRSSLWL